MHEDDARRRPRLRRWIANKIEELTGGRSAKGVYAVPSAPEPEPEPEPKPDPRDQEKARLARELEDAQLMLMGKEAEFRNDLQELKERNAELLDKVVRLTQRDRELQARIVDAQFDGSGAKAEVKKLEEELRDLRRAYKRKEQELATVSDHGAQLQSDNVAARERIPGHDGGECHEVLEQAMQALDEQKIRIQADLDQVADLAADRDRLRSRLTHAEDGMAALKEQITSAVTRRAGPAEPPRDPEPAPQGDAAPGPDPQPAQAKLAAKPAPAPYQPAPPARSAPLLRPPEEASGRDEELLLRRAAGWTLQAAEATQTTTARRAALARQTLDVIQTRGGVPRLSAATRQRLAEQAPAPRSRRKKGSGRGRGGPSRRSRKPRGPRSRRSNRS